MRVVDAVGFNALAWTVEPCGRDRRSTPRMQSLIQVGQLIFDLRFRFGLNGQSRFDITSGTSVFALAFHYILVSLERGGNKPPKHVGPNINNSHETST